MSIGTAVTWFFNLLTITWPPIYKSSKPYGVSGFGMYAAFNVVGFVLILLFVPETKNRTLEELDKVFEVSSKDQARHGINMALQGVMSMGMIFRRRRRPGADREGISAVESPSGMLEYDREDFPIEK
jgi:Sugar (and other) transporter